MLTLLAAQDGTGRKALLTENRKVKVIVKMNRTAPTKLKLVHRSPLGTTLPAVYVDEETGVHYFVNTAGVATPRFNSSGALYVDGEYLNREKMQDE